ncbi:MAG: hypothetical protein SPD11_13020 [Sphaerochaetaceae bacterium]|nr:hypothetical protein [Sphaerochaetaceae bacterium]
MELVCSMVLFDSGVGRKVKFFYTPHKGKVSVNLLTEKAVAVYQKDGNSIIVIHVPQASREQKPVYINNDLFNGTYRRNGEGDYHCSRSEVLAMLRFPYK